MQRTKIDWCTFVFNPVTGCLNGCQYCYARKIANRFGGHGDTSLQYESEYSDKGLKELNSPFTVIRKGNKETVAPFPYMFAPTFHHYRLNDPQRHKKGQRIFVCSMADLFGPWVPDDWIVSVFNVCKKAPQHKYMFLTKFPERYVELAKVRLLPKLDNFWYGQSISNGTAKAFFGQYHQFVSAEPLFGVVDPWGFDLVIIGAETGNRKDKIIPSEGTIGLTKYHSRCPVFMKDSLIPIIGESKMIRQLPEELLLPGEEKKEK
jgi:protein gp37